MFGKTKKTDPRGPFDPCDRGQHAFGAMGAPTQGKIDKAIKQRMFCPKCSSIIAITVHEHDDQILARQ